MIAYTGIETISNMAEEAKDEAKTIPAAINRVVIAVFAIYALLPRSRCRRCRSRRTPTATTRRCSALPEEQGGFAGDPVLGVVKHDRPRAVPAAPAEIYVGLLAATILFIATNAGIIGVSRLVYSMGMHRQVPDRLRQLHPQLPHAVDRDPRSSAAIACLTMIPGQADFLGNMYAFGAMLSFTIAHLVGDPPADQAARPRAPVPRARQRCDPRPRRCRCSRSSAASAPGSPSSSSPLLHLDVARRRHRLAGARHASSTRSTAAARAST